MSRMYICVWYVFVYTCQNKGDTGEKLLSLAWLSKGILVSRQNCQGPYLTALKSFPKPQMGTMSRDKSPSFKAI